MLGEFLRYIFVGGIAYIVDITVLYLFKEYIFQSIPYSLYLSTAAGFIAGVTVNYILCLQLVFISAKGTDLGKSNISKFVFIAIGVIGLGINELGMMVGVGLLAVNYLIVKVVIAAIVLIWNYTARKYLIFNPSLLKYNESIKI
jgi:putative flippase GtrA